MVTATMFHQLPTFWKRLSSMERSKIVYLLRVGTHLSQMPREWHEAHYSDRWAVLNWLRDGTHQLTQEQIQTLVDVQRTLPRATSGYCSDNVHPSAEALMTFKTFAGDPKKRMLSAQYSDLTDQWRRGNGEMLSPVDMHTEHIENCVNLLNESHGNLTADACMFLGWVHTKFHTVPDVKYLAEALCLAIQKADVDEVYPIFGPLAEELVARKPPRVAPEPIFDDTTFDDLLTRALKNW